MLKEDEGPDVTLYSLGSGSSGNSILLEHGGTCLLIDCGFSASDILRRIRSVGFDPERIDAVLVTHEHVDHIRGMAVLSRKLKAPVYLAAATRIECRRHGAEALNAVEFRPERPFAVGGIEVMPFRVPHDAAEPVGFRVQAGRTAVAIATDLGHAPAGVKELLRDSDVLIIESNHDLEMLKTGPYPWPLKQRIISRSGHLSNDDSASLVCETATERCRLVVLAHISRTNNRPDMAKQSCEGALKRIGLPGIAVMTADQDRPLRMMPAGLMPAGRMPAGRGPAGIAASGSGAPGSATAGAQLDLFGNEFARTGGRIRPAVKRSPSR